MSDLRAIDIDFELYKMIEMARQSFDEPSYEILKRLIRENPTKVDQTIKPPEAAPAPPQIAQRAWSRKGVLLPHGTQLRMEYNSHIHHGDVVDGQWLIEGKFYTSPSGAGKDVGITKSGKPLPSLDGWSYWQVKVPGSSRWMRLDVLRDQVQSRLV